MARMLGGPTLGGPTLGSPRHAGRARGHAGTATLHVAATMAMLGLLAVAAAMPAAGQPVPPSAGVTAPSDRAVYLQRVQAEMDGWRLKLHGMADQAEATGQETATAAKSDLRAAWSRTEAGARSLQTASAAGWDAAGWDDARSSFERASEELQHAWDKTLL